MEEVLKYFLKEKNDAISSPCQLDCNQMQHGGRELNTTSLKMFCF